MDREVGQRPSPLERSLISDKPDGIIIVYTRVDSVKEHMMKRCRMDDCHDCWWDALGVCLWNS